MITAKEACALAHKSDENPLRNLSGDASEIVDSLNDSITFMAKCGDVALFEIVLNVQLAVAQTVVDELEKNGYTVFMYQRNGEIRLDIWWEGVE